VFMVLGQSAAIAAALAIEKDNNVHKVDVKKLQSVLARNPLMNGKTPEVLVDNDNSSQVIVTGEWSSRKQGAYGMSMLIDSSKGTGNKAIRFMPALPSEGTYHIYTYIPKLPGLSSTTPVSIYDGREVKKIIIKAEDIKVEGQTSGEWISLGRYRLPKDKKVYVEITNNNADGFVIADAVLFIPE